MIKHHLGGDAKRIIGTIVAAITLVPAGIVMANPAQAYQLSGCKYAGTDPTIHIVRQGVTGDYNTAAGYAVSYWNATSAPGQFVFATAGANVTMQQYTSELDYWALTTNGNCTSGGTYQIALIVALNSAANQMGALSLYQKRLVIEHELGHVYGLCHPDGCVNGNPQTICRTNPMAVMWQGTGKFLCSTGPAPWADDVAGVTAIY